MNRALLMWRKSLNVVMLTLTGVAAFSVVSVLFLILGYLIWHGGTSLSWNFFTQLPKPVGETGGGMANAIVGSLKLLLLAAVIGLPSRSNGWRVPCGIWRADFFFRHSLHHGLVERCPVYRYRHLRVLNSCTSCEAFLHSGGRLRPGNDGDSDYRPQHGRVSASDSRNPARRGNGSGGQQMEDDRHRGAARCERRNSYRNAAGSGARSRRDGSFAVYRLQQSLLESRMVPAYRFASGDDLHLCDCTL